MRCSSFLLCVGLASFLILIYGCSLFKNAKKTTEDLSMVSQSDTMLKTFEEKDWTKYVNGNFLYQDSVKTGYSIVIWPKGSFSFSADLGFSGEAEKVLISGTEASFGTSATALELKEQDKGKLETTASQTEKATTDLKTATVVSTVSWKWVLAGLIILVLAGLWFFIRVY